MSKLDNYAIRPNSSKVFKSNSPGYDYELPNMRPESHDRFRSNKNLQNGV